MKADEDICVVGFRRGCLLKYLGAVLCVCPVETGFSGGSGGPVFGGGHRVFDRMFQRGLLYSWRGRLGL